MVTMQNNRVGICIFQPRNTERVFKKNQLVNGYEYTAILLYGDPGSGKVPDTVSVTSPVYIPGEQEDPCELWLDLPAGNLPWILFCKVSCFENSAPAWNPRHYAMKVLKVNG